MGFYLGQVSSQLEMARRQLQCRSKVQEKARVIVCCSGVAEITWVENLKAFQGRRGSRDGLCTRVEDEAAGWRLDIL